MPVAALVVLSDWVMGLGAEEAEITVLSGGEVQSAAVELVKAFGREANHTVKLSFVTTGVIQRQLAAEESPDAVIIMDTAIDEQIWKRSMTPGTRTGIAQVGVPVVAV